MHRTSRTAYLTSDSVPVSDALSRRPTAVNLPRPRDSMHRLAFFSASAATLARATPLAISVERLAERTATLTWTAVPSPPPAAPPAAYIVRYAPAGSSFVSRRTVTHPRVDLRNLRPGVAYDASISADGLDASVSFTTPATASAADAAAAVEGEAEEAPLTELSRLEIRVGRIVQVEQHPDADSLYVEKVDVGEEEPRTIVSGLVKYVPLAELQGRSVIVLCNLKPRAMRGVVSQGMLLCASDEEHTRVDPLAAPDGAPLGELVTFAGHKVAPIDAGNRATKAFDRIADGFRTNAEGVAMFEDAEFSTSAGPCISPQRLVGTVS